MRLKNDSISSNLDEIFQSQDYVDIVVSKFRLESSDLHMDSGIQKYFSGYEIAPHPAVKSKAFTWMLNIHKMDSPELGTNLCVFKKVYSFIEKFWEDVDDVDRAWVPWEWTTSVFTHYKPNSLILFAPSNKSLHSVSFDYNHLADQGTQYYGNLWYNESVVGNKVYLKYDELDLVRKVKSNKAYVKNRNHNV